VKWALPGRGKGSGDTEEYRRDEEDPLRLTDEGSPKEQPLKARSLRPYTPSLDQIAVK